MPAKQSDERTLTATEARKSILRCFKKKRPLFLWGPPGIGKSELVAGIADELGGYMIDLRLGQMEPTDIRGIPFYNKDLGKMDWAAPVDLPDEELAGQYPLIVLFLDELNSAPPAVQSAAYQLILNRRVGKYVLPDNVVMIAAGNRESDKGVTFRMPTPLANRFVHQEIRVDHASWEQWAVNNKIHKDVVGYIGFAKQDLFDFDPRSSTRAFPTPRSWSFVSQFCEDKDMTDAELTNLIAGTVGEGVAIKFMAHRKVAGKMPNPDDVLSGKVTTLDTKEVSAQYSLAVSMCYSLQEKFLACKGDKTELDKWHPLADNFLKYMMDNFNTELVVMGSRVALTTYNLPLIPTKLKNFDEFHKRFGKYVLAASAREKN
jgi:ATPase family associated with various cellular activities (AAA)